MNTEILIAAVTVLGAITSLVAAVASFRRDEIKSRIERSTLVSKEHDRKRALEKQVSEDTVGLYRQLSEQYQALTEKDRKLLHTITFVVRKLIVLERTLSDLISDMESRWDMHEVEAHEITCPFYDEMTTYMWSRVKGIEDIVTETMEEVDSLLLNGGYKDTKYTK